MGAPGKDMTVKDDILGIIAPIILLGILFLPVGAGILVVPLALYFRGVVGWLLLALTIIDYCVPLRRDPWKQYADMWMCNLATSYRNYFDACALRVDPEFRLRK